MKTKKYLFNVLGITKHADLHLGSGDMGKLNGTAETLVLLRIVVLQPDLEFNGLREFAILILRVGHNASNGLLQSLNLELTVIERCDIDRLQ